MGSAPFRAVFPRSDNAAPPSSAPIATTQIAFETTSDASDETVEANEASIADVDAIHAVPKRRAFSAFSFDILGSALGKRSRAPETRSDDPGEQSRTTEHPDPDAGALAFSEEVDTARNAARALLETAGDSEPRDEYDEADRAIPTIVMASEFASIERSRPPLTRLPLRPVRSDITWPLALPEPDGQWTPERRHAVLRGFARSPDVRVAPMLRTAFREEDPAGRLLALRALAKAWTDSAHDAFAEALDRGSDDERALAVDVFADHDERELLARALHDRLDAVAARAALALVGPGTRAEFETALSPLVDGARLDAILGLLAAVIA